MLFNLSDLVTSLFILCTQHPIALLYHACHVVSAPSLARTSARQHCWRILTCWVSKLMSAAHSPCRCDSLTQHLFFICFAISSSIDMHYSYFIIQMPNELRDWWVCWLVSIRPEGATCSLATLSGMTERIRDAGYQGNSWGENVAWWWGGAKDVVMGWMWWVWKYQDKVLTVLIDDLSIC